MRPIKRSQPTSDASPPWAGMKFTQPVDSDALHELLKEQYPQCKTLRQRKHMAAIDFLRLELESMQHESTESTTGTSCETQALSALDASRPGVEELAALTHRRSVSPSLSRSSSYRSPVHLDDHIPQIGVGQQHVFSIVDGFATQPKKKRKMTPAERSAYKTTRKVGACDKCKRQKGKCTHVIGKLVSMAKPLQEEKAVSQRLNATLPESMTAFNAEEPARTHQQTQELSQQQRTPLRTTPTTQSNTVPGSPQWTQEVHGMQEDSQSGMSGTPASVTPSSSEASSPITSTTSSPDTPETTVTTPTATTLA